MTVLEVIGLEKEYTNRSGGSTVRALRGVNFAVDAGEYVAIMGESGSGKTTLMNMLSGIYHPDSGEILVDGRPAVISSPIDAMGLGIGMIHQHFKRQSKQKNHRLIDSIIRSLLLNSIQFTRYLFSNQGI